MEYFEYESVMISEFCTIIDYVIRMYTTPKSSLVASMDALLAWEVYFGDPHKYRTKYSLHSTENNIF